MSKCPFIGFIERSEEQRERESSSFISNHKNQMLLSPFPPQIPLPTTQSNYCLAPVFSLNHNKPQPHSPCACRATVNTSAQRPLSLPPTALNHVSFTSDEDSSASDDDSMVSSAAAIAAAMRAASTSPVEFVHRLEKGGANSKSMVLPSQDFQRLCVEQLDLFRRIVHPDALLSVYVRPAGSYVMDQLELRRITLYPVVTEAEIVVLVGNFHIPAGLRVAEAAISSQQAEFLPELGAVVFPMVTHPFVVGFLVAELPVASKSEWVDQNDFKCSGESFPLPHSMDSQPLDVKTSKDHSVDKLKFSTDQKINAIHITRSLATAYIMDQKAMLLQQSSWQNNIRMNNLVEQIRSSLSNIRTLSKMLSVQLKKSEISYDIAEDIVVQGDYMNDKLQKLQDAVVVTKANILRYYKGTHKKIQQSSDVDPATSTRLSNMQEFTGQLSLSSASKDSEFPMPPLALAPLRQQEIRPCEVSDVLQDLVGAIRPLAHNQERVVELHDLSRSLKVAVEEAALRQALSNLIEGALLRTEVGGRIEIISTEAPAGGVLIIIDDDGPDMHYMTQMHSLTPFGSDLLYGEDRLEDNMAWNFVAGLSVAREILESYGCVVRVVSPRNSVGGTHIQIWLPSSPSTSHTPTFTHQASQT